MALIRSLPGLCIKVRNGNRSCKRHSRSGKRKAWNILHCCMSLCGLSAMRIGPEPCTDYSFKRTDECMFSTFTGESDTICVPFSWANLGLAVWKKTWSFYSKVYALIMERVYTQTLSAWVWRVTLPQWQCQWISQKLRREISIRIHLYN